MELNELPLEIVEKILSYLTIKEKFLCERVCRLWQRLLFHSVRILAFEGFDDVFCGFHEHIVSKQNYLPSMVNDDEKAMKCIISKCSKQLRSFKGFISDVTMRFIAQCCKRIHCIDMRFDDVKSLKILVDTFGKQLTCATLYINFWFAVTSVLPICPNLTSVALIPKPEGPVDILELGALQYYLPECHCHCQSGEPVVFDSVRNLVIKEYVTPETLIWLPLFNNLKMASITLTNDFYPPMLLDWQEVMKSWSTVRSLYLKGTYDCCDQCQPLPTDLEYLSLNMLMDDIEHEPIKLSSELPKLRTLDIYRAHMPPDHCRPLLESLVFYSSSLEELSLSFNFVLNDEDLAYRQIDEHLEPLLSLSLLKKLKLNLREEFKISDDFATRLITELEDLTSIGSRGSDLYTKYWMPGGSLFWQALLDKATAHPSKSFNLIGVADDQLHLRTPLPSNVSVCLTNGGMVKLSNGFGTSTQWKELTDRWCELTKLMIKIKGVDLFLNGLPKSTQNLTIKCSNEKEYGVRNAFVFSTLLPNLHEFKIYQNLMSNQQLGETVSCICRNCPNLRKLCIDRGNSEHEPADEQLVDLLSCYYLECLSLTDKFKISDVFWCRLVNEVDTLCDFGCFEYPLGFQFGPLFLNALVTKCNVRQKRVYLYGGPNNRQLKQMLKPVQKPELLSVVPQSSNQSPRSPFIDYDSDCE